MTHHAQRAAAWLRKWADEIEAQPERWTTDAFARDADGTPVNPTSADAVCWCIRGAVRRDFPDPLRPLVIAAGVRFPMPHENDNCESAADMAALCRRTAEQLERLS